MQTLKIITIEIETSFKFSFLNNLLELHSIKFSFCPLCLPFHYIKILSMLRKFSKLGRFSRTSLAFWIFLKPFQRWNVYWAGLIKKLILWTYLLCRVSSFLFGNIYARLHRDLQLEIFVDYENKFGVRMRCSKNRISFKKND